MREFYFEDKKKNIGFQGIVPSNDVNCPPFDYFRYTYAEQCYNNFIWILKHKCPVRISEHMVRQIVLKQIDEEIDYLLSSASQKPELNKLLTDVTLSYKEQNTLLKGVTLKAADILWFNKETQKLGYLLDVYHLEKYPAKFEQKKKPVAFSKKENGSIETIGSTEMTDGEMRTLLDQRKVVQARVYHKGECWHCFYFTFKGLVGKESGVMGATPYYPYLSDKSGIT